MKFIAIGAALTALMGGAAAFALTTTDAQPEAAPTPHAAIEPGPVQLPSAAPTKQRKAEPRAERTEPTDDLGPRSERMERIEIGMTATEVVAEIGTADYCTEESTDFGYDVSCWYGAWLVWHSNSVVQSVTYYSSEA